MVRALELTEAAHPPESSVVGRPGGSELLRARGLTKRYGPVEALQSADLDVAPGEIVALAGENGSGKSTLAKIVAGVLAPDAGEVRVGGAAGAVSAPRQALRAGVALVSQEPTGVPGLSVAENVLLPSLRPSSTVRRRDLTRRALPTLEALELEVDPRARLGSLSVGERELVEIAKALAGEPRLLILDEATTRLPDPERLFGVVERLAREGVGTIFITHRLREIRRLADRAVVLRDGRVVAGLQRDELSDERISAAMVGRELAEFRHQARVGGREPVLRVRDVRLRPRAAPVSLSVRPGEIVGLAGLAGSGRTTLLETIAGARRRHGGAIHLDGTPLASGSVRAAIAAGARLVPENRVEHGLVADANIAENLALGRRGALRRTRRRAERETAATAIARFDIRARGPQTPVRSLSGGNQQKVVLARCLAGPPRLLLLDEPTRGVDVGARQQIYGLIEEVAAARMAVLLASSELLEILALCDRVIVLHDGALAGELPREAASEERIALLSAGGESSQ